MPNINTSPIYVRIKPEYAEKIDSLKETIKNETKINVSNTGVIYYALDMILEKNDFQMKGETA